MRALFRILVRTFGVLLTISAVAGAVVLDRGARAFGEPASPGTRIRSAGDASTGNASTGDRVLDEEFAASLGLRAAEVELLGEFRSGSLACSFDDVDGCAPDRGGELLTLVCDWAQ